LETGKGRLGARFRRLKKKTAKEEKRLPNLKVPGPKGTKLGRKGKGGPAFRNRGGPQKEKSGTINKIEGQKRQGHWEKRHDQKERKARHARKRKSRPQSQKEAC